MARSNKDNSFRPMPDVTGGILVGGGIIIGLMYLFIKLLSVLLGNWEESLIEDLEENVYDREGK